MTPPLHLALVAFATCAFATAANAQSLWDVQFASSADVGGAISPQSGALILGSSGDPAWNLLGQGSPGGTGIQINNTAGGNPLTLTTSYLNTYNSPGVTDCNLLNDYAYSATGYAPPPPLAVTIAGLTANAQYELVLYSAGGPGQGGIWTVNGSSFGTTTAASRLIGAGSGDAYIEGVVTADGSGVLTLNGMPTTIAGGIYVCLNGFQLESVGPLTVASSLNPSTYGGAVTFTASYAGSGPTPTGTVTFEDGTTTLGTSNLVAGVATLTTTSLPAGASQTITAVYSGDFNYPGGTNTLPGGQTVNPTPAMTLSALWDVQFASSTNLGGALSQQSGALILGSSGDPAWNLLGQGSPGGTGIQINNTAGNYILTLTSDYINEFNTSDATDCNLLKDYAYSETGYAPLVETIAGLTANAQYELVLYSDGGAGQGGICTVNGSSFGATTAAADLVSAGAGAAYIQGVVTADGGGVLTLVGVPNGVGYFVCLNGFQLEPLIVSSSLNPSTYGGAVTFTASYAGSGAFPTPTGTVTFYDGSTVLGASNLVAGVATLTTISLPVGVSQTITAVYSGDGNYAGSTNTLAGGQTVKPPLAVTLSTLWDVQFGNPNGLSQQSGALILGSSGDPWNLLGQATGGSGITIIDTTANYALTLTTAYLNEYNSPDATDCNLLKDYAYAYDGPGFSPLFINVAIAGLTPNALYELVLYSAGGAGQGGTWTVNGSSFATTTAAYSLISAGPGVAYVQGLVTADGGGGLTLLGGPNGVSPYTALNGFQLELAVSVNTNPTYITATVSGNVLQLSWPADHTGWRLLVQTNNLGGISSNANDWATVPGSTGINQTNITISPANPTEFYRLVYP